MITTMRRVRTGNAQASGKGWKERGGDNTIKRGTRSMLHITIRHEENKRVTAQYEQKGNKPGQNMTRKRDRYLGEVFEEETCGAYKANKGHPHPAQPHRS